MKIKLDENLSPQMVNVLQIAGHDVETVLSEGLSGATDQTVIKACLLEGRCLITNDVGIGNPIAFPPRKLAGVVLIRFPDEHNVQDHLDAANTLAEVLPLDTLGGELWVLKGKVVRKFKG